MLSGIRVIPMIVVLFTLPAGAALTIVGDPLVGQPGDVGTLWVHSDDSLAYAVWLEIANPLVADFKGTPICVNEWGWLCPSQPSWYPEYGAWYGATVCSGGRMTVHIMFKMKGQTFLNLYAEDGVTKLDSAQIIVIPEPATAVLLGAGVWFVRRRGTGGRARGVRFGYRPDASLRSA